MSTKPKLAVFLAILLTALAPQLIRAATSVSQNGITWHFKEDRQIGQFVNGEFWVIGPVTITKITPEDTNLGDSTDMHGSMVNPGSGQHAFDSKTATSRYKRELNVARQMPLNLKAGDSLISTESGSANKENIVNAAVLTVLDKAPPAGTFRPPYMGTQKPFFYKSQLDFSALLRLTPTPSAPTPSSLANREVKHVLIDVIRGWQTTEVKAKGLTPGYGREIAKAHTAAALALQLDYSNAEKESLLIELVQRGIDVYGAILNGHQWQADGGHNHGRKVALYIAAKTLNHADMLSKCDATVFKGFQEDTQHFFVTQKDVDTIRVPTTKVPYLSEHIGMPDWGSQAVSQPERNSPDWSYTGYRFINGQSNLGLVLLVTLLGDRDRWNSEALFEYTIKRYWPIETTTPSQSVGSTNGIPRFTYEMWNKYFGNKAPEHSVLTPEATISPSGGTYSNAIQVELSANQSDAAIYYTTNGQTPTSASQRYHSPLSIEANTEIKAIAVADGATSSIRSAIYSFKAAQPDINPAPGSYDHDIQVELDSATHNANIYYTLDGRDPMVHGTLYKEAILVNESTIIRSYSALAGYQSSPVSDHAYLVREYSSNNQWQNTGYASQSGSFSVTFTATPGANNIDAVTGLSAGATTAFSDLACAVRFWTDGTIQARNGSTYDSDHIIAYESGQKYQVTMEVDLNLKTYSVHIATKGAETVTIAESYQFRTEQESVSALDTLSYIASAGQTHYVGQISINDSLKPQAPSALKLGSLAGTNF